MNLRHLGLILSIWPTSNVFAGPHAGTAIDDRTGKVATLQMLAAHTRSNFEKIKTWSATYDLKDTSPITDKQLAEYQDLYGKDISPSPPRTREDEGVVTFVLSGDSLFTECNVKTPFLQRLAPKRYLDPDGKPLEKYLYRHKRSVVTSEHYLHYQPNRSYGRFRALPNAEPSTGRAAFRDPVENSDGQEQGEIVDPRNFFEVGRSHWNELNSYCEFYSNGDISEEDRSTFDKGLLLRTHENPESIVYEVSLTLRQSMKSGPEMTQRYLFDSAFAFNPTEYSYSDSQGQKQLHYTWKYVERDGCVIPAEIRYRKYSPRTGELLFDRVLRMRLCSLNAPVDPGTFTYAGLGLKTGERVLDRIENKVYVFDGAKLATPNETVVAANGLFQGNVRLVLIGLNVAAIFVLATVLARRKVRAPA